MSELEPFEKNPKKHPGSQIKLLVRSIEEFGFTSPILTVEHNGKHLIIAGHARFKAAKEKGLKSVPTINLGLPYEKAVAYNLADNRLAELADWDLKLVRLLMSEEISEALWDVTGFGNLMRKDDNFVPQLNPASRCALGQIWRLGNHRLMCGDSTNEKDLEKLMAGAKVDMILTDPPYIGMSESVYKRGFGYSRRGNYSKKTKQEFPSPNEYLSVAVKFLKDDSGILIFEFWRSIPILWHEIEKYFKVQNCLIWHVTNRKHGYAQKSFYNNYDPIIYGIRGKSKFNLSNARIFGSKDVFEYPTSNISESGQNEILGVKPVLLLSRLLELTSEQNDIILDLFGGSGSVLLSCEQLKRINFTMEIEPRYCEVIMQRWEKYTGKQAELIEDAN